MNKGTIQVSVNSAAALAAGTQIIGDYSDVVQRMPMSGGPMIQNSQLAYPSGNVTGPTFKSAVGNLSFKREFKITRQWSDNKKSNDFYETAVQTYAGVWDVLVSHLDYSGATTTYKYPNAQVELVVNEPIGVSTECTLTVTAGAAVLM